MPSKTRLTRKNHSIVTKKFITEFMSTLETAILFNTKKQNYELLRKNSRGKSRNHHYKNKTNYLKIERNGRTNPIINRRNIQ